MNITFDTSSTKSKKAWMFAPTEDIHLPPCSDNLKAMVIAAHTLSKNFTLEELAVEAESSVKDGWKTKGDIGPDYNAIGYTHRPKLIKMGIIVEFVEAEEETEEVVA